MSGPVLALIPARDEAGRVGETVTAARSLGGVSHVVVVDDGSADATAEEARAAGAHVLRTPRGRGKGEALEAALDRMDPAGAYLLLDADLGPTAAEGKRLLEELDRSADLAIGVLPRDPRHGGFRLVKRLSAGVIRGLSGFRATEPMSGQRAITREALEAVRPLARGFGVETAMTVDAVRLGFRVVEVPVRMRHRPTARDLRGFLHRGRQGRDVLRAASLRALRLR